MLLPDLLAAAARADGSREAIRGPGGSWDYERLDAAASSIAGALADLGVERGDRVGILLPKQPASLAAVYGILRAGAAYVPLDTFAPERYVAGIAHHAGIRALASTRRDAARALPSMDRSALLGVVDVGEDEGRASGPDLGVPTIRGSDARAGGSDAGPRSGSDLACILYTSGATGTPKGVMHSHDSIAAGSRWFTRTMGLGPDDRLYAAAPLSFLLSIYAIFPAALARATAVLSRMERPYRGDVVPLVLGEGITTWISTPFPFRMLLAGARAGSLGSLRSILVGGGTLTGRDVRTLREVAPAARLWQGYGSTEAMTITCHLVRRDPEGDGPVPIGSPLDDVTLELVGEDGGPAGPGGEGEVYVRSGRLMAGYWADPGRTALALVPHPWDSGDPGPYYRTGDIVRRQEDGALEFVRRTDHTVKTRGYLVDLTDVEAALDAHPATREAVVVAVPHAEWGVSLVAFLEVADGARVTDRELRGHVGTLLPSYMVPRRFRVLASLPRTPSGKVDRVGLAARALDAERGAHTGAR